MQESNKKTRFLPYGRQNISTDDIDEVNRVLKSDFLTQGPKVPLFEEEISKKVNAKYAVASNSATSSLHLACLALGLGKKDYLWTTPITFVASANCALYCGAQVDFVDINQETALIDINKLEIKLQYAQKISKLPKILVPVHFAGSSCDMKSIYELSKKYGFYIVEDASHAIGGRYLNDPVGSCKYSNITVFSFHPVKIITTGEGGMATTNNKKIAEKLSLLRTHGITRNEDIMINKSDGPWYYEQIDLGFNYRMTDIQAALGVSQMNRLDEFVEKRHKIFERYNSYFRNLPIKTPWQNNSCFSSMHLYVMRVDSHESGISHKTLFNFLRDNKIGVNIHYIPIYRQPYYSKFGYKYSDFPESEMYYSEAISIPIYPDLDKKSQEYICDLIKSQVENN